MKKRTPEPPTIVHVPTGVVDLDLYLDHIARRPACCHCSQIGPADDCMVGFAIWKMKQSEARRFDDGRRGR